MLTLDTGKTGLQVEEQTDKKYTTYVRFFFIQVIQT